jgi:hypothetical protein
MGRANKDAREGLVNTIGKMLDGMSMKGIGNTKPENLIIHKPTPPEPPVAPTKETGSLLGSPQAKAEFLKSTGYKMNE